ncbi:MAG: DUF2156 domain-containing protein [Candidatus Omnitrophica bacterium]|nr:DUF2156 domain-containing protein [Candidatus Omnitrophota bacterium]
MQLRRLTPEHRELFNKYLRLREHELSVYAFENIFIWKGLFEISWAVIGGQLCIFFRDYIGAFLYLPPLGRRNDAGVAEKVFAALAGMNRNREVCRIENIEEQDRGFFEGLGLVCSRKSHDYLYNRAALAGLCGNDFKHKRSAANFFRKNYSYEYLPYRAHDRDACLSLYRKWQEERAARNTDPLYRGMLRDGLACLEIMLGNYRKLCLTGRVIKSEDKVRAFTFGFKLNPQTACILYEVADLSLKGASQFIFQSFCRELEDYKYINAMDDSGLENLKKVKLSYRPYRLVPAYIARKK